MTTNQDVTALLDRLAKGHEGAAEELWPLVYGELHRLADRYFHDEQAAHTLQPTALVHEAFLRLTASDVGAFQTRDQFFTIAARAMRRILIDHARKRRAAKRGGDRKKLPLDMVDTPSFAEDDRLLALDEALHKLADTDQQLSRLVELHFFGGLTFEETSRLMGVSAITAKRMWKMAKGWLFREMSDED